MSEKRDMDPPETYDWCDPLYVVNSSIEGRGMQERNAGIESKSEKERSRASERKKTEG